MSKLCLGLASAFFMVAISFSGCCGPMGPIGPGCANLSCNDCSGCGSSTQYIANGPLDALRNARRRMVCGAGCGEAYVGEWISTPPDAADPCCGNQFVGGATKCRPFCGRPGGLIRGMYGQRFCSGDASSTPCGCDGGCAVASSSPVISERVMTAPATSTCGCGTCSASTGGAQKSTTQVAANRPKADNATAKTVAKQPKARAKQATKEVVR